MAKLSQTWLLAVSLIFRFSPHQERLANLVQSYKELQHSVTEYSQAYPNDSAAEGHLKNVLEGLLIGLLIKFFSHSLRALKYLRIKWMVSDVKTIAHYKLETEINEAESGSKDNWNKELNNPKPNKIYTVVGNRTYHIDYLG